MRVHVLHNAYKATTTYTPAGKKNTTSPQITCAYMRYAHWDDCILPLLVSLSPNQLGLWDPSPLTPLVFTA